MPYNPENFVGEVLGQAATKGVNPAATNYRCPFMDVRCVKRSTSLKDTPYPVCTIWYGRGDSRELICVCPKRFYAVDFLNDVIEHCWPADDPPANPQIASEVKMKGFGNVDFVIADVDTSGDVSQFLSVELQAIDITGSVMPAYVALLAGDDLDRKPTYGLNWDNVYKRYITQLIRKGYFHHHWGTKIVAVMQDVIYKNICERAEFMRSADVKNPVTNIIFMAYRFDPDPESPGQFRPVLATVEGTSHANLQQAILYKEPPSRDDFCQRIKRSIERRTSGEKTKAFWKDLGLDAS